MLMFTARRIGREQCAPQITRFISEVFLTLPHADPDAGPLYENAPRLTKHVAFARAMAFHGLNTTTSQTGVALIQAQWDGSPQSIVTVFADGASSRHPFGLRLPHCPFCEEQHHALCVQATPNGSNVAFTCSREGCRARAMASKPEGVVRLNSPLMADGNYMWIHPLNPPSLQWTKGEGHLQQQQTSPWEIEKLEYGELAKEDTGDGATDE